MVQFRSILPDVSLGFSSIVVQSRIDPAYVGVVGAAHCERPQVEYKENGGSC